MSADLDEPAPLGEGARRLVDAARPHERLSAERRAALRGRVMAAVAAGTAAGVAAGAAKAAELGAAAGSGAGGAAVKAAGLSLFAKIGLSVAVVTVGVGGLLWSRAQDASSRPAPSSAATSSATFMEAPSSPPEVAAGSTAGAPATAAATGTSEPGAAGTSGPSAPSQAPSAVRGEKAAPSGEAAPEDSLQEEMKLLAAAHGELSKGNAAGALALLDEHAARFPRGTMAVERRAARAMALCKAGRADEGRRELTALYGKDPKSPTAQRIARACGE